MTTAKRRELSIERGFISPGDVLSIEHDDGEVVIVFAIPEAHKLAGTASDRRAGKFWWFGEMTIAEPLVLGRRAWINFAHGGSDRDNPTIEVIVRRAFLRTASGVFELI